MTGTLYLVATPIGNLQDITFRALETLRSVALIACEDTRHTQKLLNHFEIKKRLVSYHEHNEKERAEELAALLADGQSIAVVSDAGTPAVCDPSFRIVERAVAIGAPVVAIPGAVAFVNALVVSGLPTDSVFFGGFLPSKRNERLRRLAEVRELPATLVFYESPHRLEKSLADCLEVLGDRRAAVARELTKLHEEVRRGPLSELLSEISGNQIRGEIVLVLNRYTVEPKRSEVKGAGTLKNRLAELESEGLERKAALKKIAREFGLSRSEVYRRLLID
ncbi:MAG: 16S rRNA (cytidine(1402)-2'-O)-methyltransferase [Acidobacteria bacterium]|nr:16S rRNA (cytidine(1402)-2'-O)-methyltransferase [Acidobacteriota bacterium]